MNKTREALEAAQEILKHMHAEGGKGIANHVRMNTALAKIDAALHELDEAKPSYAARGRSESLRDTLISTACLAVVSERQGRYPGAARIADAVLNAERLFNDAAPPVPSLTPGERAFLEDHAPTMLDAPPAPDTERALTQEEGEAMQAALLRSGTKVNAPDAEDAARYRWLRVRINSIQLWPAEKALDAMIDAAINARFDAARGSEHG